MLKAKIDVKQNTLTKDLVASAKIVDLQTINFDKFCELCTGSSVEKADIAAVLIKVMDTLPKLVALGNKCVISPDGITVRPTVSGSLTQEQLHQRLLASGDENPDRKLTPSDLTIASLKAGITIEFSKKFLTQFSNLAEFKRVNTTGTVTDDDTDTDSDNTQSGDTSTTDNDDAGM